MIVIFLKSVFICFFNNFIFYFFYSFFFFYFFFFFFFFIFFFLFSFLIILLIIASRPFLVVILFFFISLLSGLKKNSIGLNCGEYGTFISFFLLSSLSISTSAIDLCIVNPSIKRTSFFMFGI